MNHLLLRAGAAFLLLPGVVAGLVPWIIAQDAVYRWRPGGLAVIGLGAALLLWCVRDFYVAGKGTLAPWDPPRRLVVVGLYRFSRNPMYLAVLIVLAGWAVTFRSGALTVYAAALAAAFHLRVLLYEEPTLARRHGESWKRYKAAVPRWIVPARRRGGARE